MTVRKFRFIPHPEDQVEVSILYDNRFDFIDIFIDDSEEDVNLPPFVTQVSDRLTVQNSYIHVKGELVNSTWSYKIKEDEGR